MSDLAAAYTETRDRLVEVVRPLDEPGLAVIVPATPAWTIKDVVAHLTHVAGAYAAGYHSYSTQDVNKFARSRCPTTCPTSTAGPKTALTNEALARSSRSSTNGSKKQAHCA